jgi:peptide/nickel transport system ATP-binding protein
VSLLAVENLTIGFDSGAHPLRVVEATSFALDAGSTMGLVGESGCGKSVTAMSIMRLLPSPPSRVFGGRIMFEGQDLLALSPEKMRAIRGDRIGMVFQEPMTSLNPVLSIGFQIEEVLRLHRGLSQAEARVRALEMLGHVGIGAPERRLAQYPHQLSGGLRQRVMIAIALVCRPQLLIADEPTTALDVSVQSQIIELLRRMCRAHGAGVMLVTHDMGVIAGACDRVAVMYAGRVVEVGDLAAVVRHPAHPYTAGLMAAIPSLGKRVQRLAQIDGAMPRLDAIPHGCAFHPRCKQAFGPCAALRPPLISTARAEAACWLHAPPTESVK